MDRRLKLTVELNFDTEATKRQFQAFGRELRSQKIPVTIDAASVRSQKVQVDTSKIKSLRVPVSVTPGDSASLGAAVRAGLVNAAPETGRVISEKIAQLVPDAIEKAMRGKGGKGGGGIGGAIGNLLSMPFKIAGGALGGVAEGLIFGITQEITKDLGKGLSQGIEARVQKFVGSNQLAGETLANVSADAIGELIDRGLGRLPKKLRESIKKRTQTVARGIQEAVGEEEIATTVLSRRQQRSTAENRRRRQARQQANVDRQEILREELRQRPEIEANIAEIDRKQAELLEKSQAEIDRLQQRIKDLKGRRSPESEKGIRELDQSIQAAEKQLAKAPEQEREKLQEQVKGLRSQRSQQIGAVLATAEQQLAKLQADALAAIQPQQDQIKQRIQQLQAQRSPELEQKIQQTQARLDKVLADELAKSQPQRQQLESQIKQLQEQRSKAAPGDRAGIDAQISRSQAQLDQIQSDARVVTRKEQEPIKAELEKLKSQRSPETEKQIALALRQLKQVEAQALASIQDQQSFLQGQIKRLQLDRSIAVAEEQLGKLEYDPKKVLEKGKQLQGQIKGLRTQEEQAAPEDKTAIGESIAKSEAELAQLQADVQGVNRRRAQLETQIEKLKAERSSTTATDSLKLEEIIALTEGRLAQILLPILELGQIRDALQARLAEFERKSLEVLQTGESIGAPQQQRKALARNYQAIEGELNPLQERIAEIQGVRRKGERRLVELQGQLEQSRGTDKEAQIVFEVEDLAKDLQIIDRELERLQAQEATLKGRLEQVQSQFIKAMEVPDQLIQVFDDLGIALTENLPRVIADPANLKRKGREVAYDLEANALLVTEEFFDAIQKAELTPDQIQNLRQVVARAAAVEFGSVRAMEEMERGKFPRGIPVVEQPPQSVSVQPPPRPATAQAAPPKTSPFGQVADPWNSAAEYDDSGLIAELEDLQKRRDRLALLVREYLEQQDDAAARKAILIQKQTEARIAEVEKLIGTSAQTDFVSEELPPLYRQMFDLVAQASGQQVDESQIPSLKLDGSLSGDVARYNPQENFVRVSGQAFQRLREGDINNFDPNFLHEFRHAFQHAFGRDASGGSVQLLSATQDELDKGLKQLIDFSVNAYSGSRPKEQIQAVEEDAYVFTQRMFDALAQGIQKAEDIARYVQSPEAYAENVRRQQQESRTDVVTATEQAQKRRADSPPEERGGGLVVRETTAITKEGNAVSSALGFVAGGIKQAGQLIWKGLTGLESLAFDIVPFGSTLGPVAKKGIQDVTRYVALPAAGMFAASGTPIGEFALNAFSGLAHLGFDPLAMTAHRELNWIAHQVIEAIVPSILRGQEVNLLQLPQFLGGGSLSFTTPDVAKELAIQASHAITEFTTGASNLASTTTGAIVGGNVALGVAGAAGKAGIGQAQKALSGEYQLALPSGQKGVLDTAGENLNQAITAVVQRTQQDLAQVRDAIVERFPGVEQAWQKVEEVTTAVVQRAQQDLAQVQGEIAERFPQLQGAAEKVQQTITPILEEGKVRLEKAAADLANVDWTEQQEKLQQVGRQIQEEIQQRTQQVLADHPELIEAFEQLQQRTNDLAQKAQAEIEQLTQQVREQYPQLDQATAELQEKSQSIAQKLEADLRQTVTNLAQGVQGKVQEIGEAIADNSTGAVREVAQKTLNVVGKAAEQVRTEANTFTVKAEAVVDDDPWTGQEPLQLPFAPAAMPERELVEVQQQPPPRQQPRQAAKEAGPAIETPIQSAIVEPKMPEPEAVVSVPDEEKRQADWRSASKRIDDSQSRLKELKQKKQRIFELIDAGWQELAKQVAEEYVAESQQTYQELSDLLAELKRLGVDTSFGGITSSTIGRQKSQLNREASAVRKNVLQRDKTPEELFSFAADAPSNPLASRVGQAFSEAVSNPKIQGMVTDLAINAVGFALSKVGQQYGLVPELSGDLIGALVARQTVNTGRVAYEAHQDLLADESYRAATALEKLGRVLEETVRRLQSGRGAGQLGNELTGDLAGWVVGNAFAKGMEALVPSTALIPAKGAAAAFAVVPKLQKARQQFSGDSEELFGFTDQALPNLLGRVNAVTGNILKVFSQGSASREDSPLPLPNAASERDLALEEVQKAEAHFYKLINDGLKISQQQILEEEQEFLNRRIAIYQKYLEVIEKLSGREKEIKTEGVLPDEERTIAQDRTVIQPDEERTIAQDRTVIQSSTQDETVVAPLSDQDLRDAMVRRQARSPDEARLEQLERQRDALETPKPPESLSLEELRKELEQTESQAEETQKALDDFLNRAAIAVVEAQDKIDQAQLEQARKVQENIQKRIAEANLAIDKADERLAELGGPPIDPEQRLRRDVREQELLMPVGTAQMPDTTQLLNKVQADIQQANEAIKLAEQEMALLDAGLPRPESEITTKIFEEVGKTAESARIGLGKFAQGAEQATKSLGGMEKVLGLAKKGFDFLLRNAKEALLAFVAFQLLDIGQIIYQVAEFGKQTFETAKRLEALQTALNNAVGGARAGAEEMAFIRAEVDRLNIPLEGAISGYTRLAASTKGTVLEGKRTQEMFAALAQAARVYNLSQDEFNRLLTASGQVLSKGTVASEELRGQIGEVLPGAFNIFARSAGVSTEKLSKILEQGKAGPEDFFKFTQQLAKDTAAGVEAANQTSASALQQLANEFTQFQAVIGQAITPAAIAAFDALGSAMAAITPVFEAVANVVGAVATATGNLGSLLGSVSGPILGTLGAVLKTILIDWKGLEAVLSAVAVVVAFKFGPALIGLALNAIPLVVTGIQSMVAASLAFLATPLGAAIAALTVGFMAMRPALDEIGTLMGGMTGEQLAAAEAANQFGDDYNKALDKLNRGIPLTEEEVKKLKQGLQDNVKAGIDSAHTADVLSANLDKLQARAKVAAEIQARLNKTIAESEETFKKASEELETGLLKRQAELAEAQLKGEKNADQARQEDLQSEQEYSRGFLQVLQKRIADQRSILADFQQLRETGVVLSDDQLKAEKKAHEELTKAEQAFYKNRTVIARREVEIANNAILQAAKDREIATQKLVNQGVYTEKLAAVQKLESERKRIVEQMQLQGATAELTLELLNNERQQQQALSEVIKQEYDRRADAIKRGYKDQELALERVKNAEQERLDLLELQEKSLQNQERLFRAQSDLIKAQNDLRVADLELEKVKAESRNDERQLAQLAIQTAQIKRQAVLQEQEAAKQALELEIQRTAWARQRELITNNIAQIENESALAQKQADIVQAQADILTIQGRTDLTPDEKNAQLQAAQQNLISQYLQLEALLSKGNNLERSRQLIERQGIDDQEIANLQRKTLGLQQQAQLRQADAELLRATNAAADKIGGFAQALSFSSSSSGGAGGSGGGSLNFGGGFTASSNPTVAPKTSGQSSLPVGGGGALAGSSSSQVTRNLLQNAPRVDLSGRGQGQAPTVQVPLNADLKNFQSAVVEPLNDILQIMGSLSGQLLGMANRPPQYIDNRTYNTTSEPSNRGQGYRRNGL